MYKKVFKRVFDVTVSIMLLVALSPIFVLVTILLSLTNNYKPFFFQVRPGYKRRLFKIIKFKTMNDRLDAKGQLLSDEKRLTTIGALVRKTSLDELPQLINVIKGDMSLIGPRPLLPEYLALYSPEQNKRHDIRPGITGWAQVNGRNAISWNQKFKLDVWYVEHISFKVDLYIMFLTFKKVLIREGINSDTSATMEKFTGN